MARTPRSRIALRKKSARTRAGQKKYNLVVTGDVVTDHHVYKGGRDTPTTDQKPGLRDFSEQGGAALLTKLLEKSFAAIASAEKPKVEWGVHLGITTPPIDEKPCGHHAYAYWKPYLKSKDEQQKKEKDRTEVWRVQLPMGYGAPADETASNLDQDQVSYLRSSSPPKPKILVIDDAGFGFRRQANKSCWWLPAKGDAAPEWIVLKMSRPVARGDLWHTLVSRFADSLVCIVSAEELRHECVSISRGLSWERAAEEVRDALLNDPVLAEMTRCRHLIVRFAADGALWFERTASGPKARLIFDAGGIEGSWKEEREGTVFGSSATLTAAVVCGLALPKQFTLDSVIKAGLAAVRDLEEYGHGRSGTEPPCGFPVERLAAVIALGKTKFASASVPWPKSSDSSYPWMIVDFSQRPAGVTAYPTLVGLGRQVVLRGEAVLNSYPHARFGKLVVIDRLEIELLRSLRRLMVDYQEKAEAKKPLSIGVFGPPGAGKSFGVKEIAKKIFGEKAWLEFNLSQFEGPVDLVGAFHQVRDKVLSGITPVVFWDEFDSREFFWLQYLLAPMQDGRFQDDQLNHWIGKCVFVFAGGTSSTFAEFAPLSGGPDEALRKLKKVPDFHSRLDGYYNVVGPNRRALPRTQGQTDGTSEPNPAADKLKTAEPKPDPADVCFPVRRALLMRSMLGCKSDEPLDFDTYLLDALLLVQFRHGARSLEKMVSELRKDGGPIRRSGLPAPVLLAMHVCTDEFYGLLKRNEQFLKKSDQIEGLAAAIHEFWRKLSMDQGWSMRRGLNRRYDKLKPVDKEDNRAAARRIPKSLSLVGLGVAKLGGHVSPDEPSAEFLESYLSFYLELLAEAEHDGWMEQRLVNGWRKGTPRNDKKRIHPLLIPYNDLPDNEKEKDRNTIRLIPEMVRQAGYRIIWLRELGVDSTPS